MSHPEEIELHEAVLEYMSNSTDKSLITMKAIKVALEKQFGCVLDSHQSVLKKSIHAFVENLVGKDETVEIAELRNTQFKRKRGMDAIRLPVHLSPELTEFMGLAFCPRADVTKRVWDYVKAHNLQNPADRREIFCDSTLEKLFNKKKFSMFKLSKYLCEMMKNPNCVPDEDYLEFIPPKPKKLKKEKVPKGPVLSPESKAALRIQKRLVAAITKKTLRKKAAKKARKEKKKARLQAIANGEEVPMRTNGGLHKIMRLDEKLSALIGVEEDSRAQVVCKLWAYIKANELQDPTDKRKILLDAAMAEVFGVQELTMFSLNKELTSHLSHIPAPAPVQREGGSVDGGSGGDGASVGDRDGNGDRDGAGQRDMYDEDDVDDDGGDDRDEEDNENDNENEDNNDDNNEDEVVYDGEDDGEEDNGRREASPVGEEED